MTFLAVFVFLALWIAPTSYLSIRSASVGSQRVGGLLLTGAVVWFLLGMASLAAMLATHHA